MGCAIAEAQDASGSGGRGIQITTGLSASATATNNVNLSQNDSQSSLILTLTPSIQVSGQSGRVRGSLSYALGASFYSSSDQSSTFYNYLRANANVEAVPSRVFIDASASISRQLISPFGTQSSSPVLDNANSTQVSTFSVSPYATGEIAGEVNYTGRASYSVTSSGTSLASGSSTWGGLLHFDGATRISHLDWALNFSYRQFGYTEGRTTFNQLSWVALNYGGFYDLVFSARANRETSNLTSLNTETHYGYGGGVRWTPSPRTAFIAQYDTRVFGSSHLYAFNYQTARTVWSISSAQGLSTGQGTGGFGGIYGNTPAAQTTAFELFMSLFASIQPNPTLRAQLVNNFLKANGIEPNTTLQPGYLPSQTTEQLSYNASVAWSGLRSSAVFSINQTRSTNLGPLSNPGNDFANGQPITWFGFSMGWSHRLTPRDTLSLSLSQQQNSGAAESTFRSANVFWSSQLAERVSAALSGNYSVQRGSSAYNQASVTASVSITF
jgi:uncharacterized protein (PEP-CTERM system associated)